MKVPLSSEDEHGGAMGPGAGLSGPTLADAVADRDAEPFLVKCQLCQRGFAGFQALAEHMEKAHASVAGPDAEPFLAKCQHCHKCFNGFADLAEHVDKVHPSASGVDGDGVPPLLGPPQLNGAASPPQGSAGAASPPLSTTNGLPRHLKGIPGGAQGAHVCTQCSSAFATRDQLEKHELAHSPNIQVSCKVCNKTFANVYRLQRHMISHDESAVLRKFKCPECEKAFKFKHHLKEHIRIHSGEKPFECGNCGKRFSHSGSYSSHMTSKKCLVMNLKVSRANPKNGSGQPLSRSKRAPGGALNNNNNNTSNNNNNTAFPMLPKYGEGMGALFGGFTAPPFYQLPGMAGAMHPYHLTHLLEQLHASANAPQMPARSPCSPGRSLSPGRSPSPGGSPAPPSPPTQHSDHDQDHDDDDSHHDLSSALEVSIEEPGIKSEPSTEPEADRGHHDDDGEVEGESKAAEGAEPPQLDRILATVSANVLSKSFVKAESPSSVGEAPQGGECRYCRRSFASPIDLHQHERYLCPAQGDGDALSEGLAAKLEDVASQPGSAPPSHPHPSGSEDELTDHDQDGRKVRVRSQITDSQLAILKPHYAANPRPKKEELLRLAEMVKLPQRVVQVWFQNTRARDRREGRLVNGPASAAAPPPPSQSLVLQPPSEQPLDLSTKKWPAGHSLQSSPSSSPRASPGRPSSSNSEDGVMNLSRKSRSGSPRSRSPTPLSRALPFSPFYPLYARSPSPNSALWPLKRPFPGDLPLFFTKHLAPDLHGRANSSSPGSDRRSWKQCGPDGEDTPDEAEDELQIKRRALEPLAMPPFPAPLNPLLAGFGPDGSPGGVDNEPEGQFMCKQCDKVFSKQSSLARHKFEHSGQRPHKCDVCTKAFKHKHHLTEHKRLHSGEKPFQCQKCLKRFSHSGSYSQHMNHRYSYCKPYRE